MKRIWFRLTAIICVCAFALTSIPLAVSAGQNELSNAVSNTASAQRQDGVQNEVAILGEMENLREESVKYFRQEDGMMVAAVYDEPVHYQENGVWKDIDNTLTLAKTEAGVSYYRNTANLMKVLLPDQLNADIPICITNGDYTLQWVLADGESQTAQVLNPVVEEKRATTRSVTSNTTGVDSSSIATIQEKNQEYLTVAKLRGSMLYTDVYENTYLRYDMSSNRFKESIILSRETSKTEYVFDIQAQGLTASLQEDGSVRFFASGVTDPVFVMAAPYMFDSNGEVSKDINVRLISIKNGYRYVLTPSQNWLHDPERLYPVTIDPTVTTSIKSDDAIVAAGVYSRYASRNYDENDFMYAGSTYAGGAYQEYRSLVQLEMPNEVLAPDAVITNASLVLLPHYEWNNSDGSVMVNVHNNLQAWSEETITWNTKPNYDSAIVDYAMVAANPNENAYADFTVFDITELVVGWASGTLTNYGMTLKIPSEAQQSGKNACWYSDDVSAPISGGDPRRPHALITFRSGSGIESYWTYTSLAVGRNATMAVNNATGALTAIIPDCGVDGNLLPVSISHVYNATAPNDETYGGKWRLNYQMKIESAEMSQYTDDPNDDDIVSCYVFIDGDGTKHYLQPVADEENTFEDEDGLGLTLTVNASTATERYTLVDLDKNAMGFNGYGNLMCIRDTHNHQITITYDKNASDQVIKKIKDGADREYALTYANGKLTSITDPADRVTSYAYNDNQLLSRVTYPDNAYLDVVYIRRSQGEWLLSEMEADEQAVCVSYDELQLPRVSVLMVYNAGIDLPRDAYTFEYHSGTTTVGNISGSQFTYQFNAYLQTVGVASRADGRAQSYTYGAPGGTEGQENRILLSSDVKQAVVNRAVKGQIPAGYMTGDHPYSRMANGISTSGISASTDYGHTANGCICVDVDYVAETATDPYLYAAQSYAIEEDGYYTLSAFVSTNGETVEGESGAQIRLVRYCDGAVVSESATSLSYTPAGEWQRLCVSLECEAGDTLWLRLGTSGHDAFGTMYYDDVQLEAQTEAANEFNLLQNTDFYYGTDGWTVANGTWQITPVEETFSSPLKAANAYTTTGGATAQRRAYQTVTVTNGQKGDTYSMGAYAKADSVPLHNHEDSSFGICVEFQNTDNTTTTRRLSFNSVYDDWQIVAGEAIAEKPYSAVKFYLEYDKNINTVSFTLPFLYRDNYGQSYTYDKDGNVVSAMDQTQNPVEYAYSDQQLAKLANPTGSRQLFSYDADTNDLLSVQTTDGLRTEFTYDTHGNVTSTVIGADVFADEPYNGRSYYLRNVYTGNALSVQADEDGDVAAGAKIVNGRWTDADPLCQFELRYSGEAQVYYLISEADTSLWVKTGSDDTLQVGEGTSSTTYRFKFEYNADAQAFSLLTGAGGYEEAVDGTAAEEDGADVGDTLTQKPHDPEDEHQLWYLIEVNENLWNDDHIDTSATYTANGNYLASSTDALGNETTYVTDTATGNTQKVTTPDGVDTVYGYDASGLHQTSVNTAGHQVDYTYDNDLLVELEANDRQTYLFTYDQLARSDKIFVGTADAANMLVDYHYNMRGQMDRMDYGNGNFSNFSYDPLGRLEKVWYNDDTTKVAETVYNERGLVGLTKDGFSDTRTRLWYDLAGRVVQMRRTLGAAADTTDLFAEVSLDYEDSTNRLQQQRVRVLTGLDTIYSYTTGYVYGDGDEGESPNRIYAVTYNGETDLQYLYDSLGRVDTRLLADGNIETRYHYASKGYSSRSSTLVRSVAENGLYTYYDYDEMGNIVYMDDSTGRIDTYTYDDLNQLLTANVAGKAYAYTYDAGGNILTAVENGVTHTYAYGNTVWRDLLTAYDGQSITYDQIGNPLTYRNGMQFSWEHGRQLRASLNPNSSVSTYTYNADGTRHSKTVRTNVDKTTTYYYVEGVLYAVESPDYTVVFQMDDTGRSYGFRLLRNDSPGYESQLYYKYNLQGDVVGIYDATGNEVVTYTYDPWGKLLSATGVDVLIDANPLLYRGYVYDKETGFYYVSSRYYDPEIGRWINADGFVSTGQDITGYNMFAYCGNNPVNRKDPTGQFWITALIVTAVVAVCTVALSGCSAKPTSDVGAAKPYVDMPGSDDPTSPNCYAYAIGSPVNEQPGGTSGRIPTKWNDVNDVGKSVEADLKAKGHTVREISGPDAKVYDNEFKIALRVGTQPYAYNQYTGQLYYDYHFMRQTNTGQWAEKHGIGGASILWDAGMTPETIPWTLGGVPYYDSAIIYYAVGN